MKLKFNNPTVDSGGQDFTHVLTCRNECDGVLVYTIALTSVVAVSPARLYAVFRLGAAEKPFAQCVGRTRAFFDRAVRQQPSDGIAFGL